MLASSFLSAPFHPSTGMPRRGSLSKQDYRRGVVNGKAALVGSRWFVPLGAAGVEALVENEDEWLGLEDGTTGALQPFTFCSYLATDKVVLSRVFRS